MFAQLLPPLRQLQAAASSSVRDSIPTPPPIRSYNDDAQPRQVRLPSIHSLDLLPMGARARARGNISQEHHPVPVKDAHDSLLGSPEEVKPRNLTVPTPDNYGLDHRTPHNARRAYGVSRHLSISSCASDAMAFDRMSHEGDDGYDSAVSAPGLASSSSYIYARSAYSSRPATPLDADVDVKPSAGKLASLLNPEVPDSLSILSDAANESARRAREEARYEEERYMSRRRNSAFAAIKGHEGYSYRDEQHYLQAQERYRQQPELRAPQYQARHRSLSDQDQRAYASYAARAHSQQRPISPRSHHAQRRTSPSGPGPAYHRPQPYPPNYRSMQQRPSPPQHQRRAVYERHDQVVQLKAFPDFDRSLVHRASGPRASGIRQSPPNPPKLQLPDLVSQRASQESPMSRAPKQPGTIALRSIDDADMPSIDRPFACPGCDRTFTRRYDRNRHARKHTGEKPYPCGNPNCTEGYGRPDALQRHYRSHPECDVFRNNTARRTSVSSSSEGEPRRESPKPDGMIVD